MHYKTLIISVLAAVLLMSTAGLSAAESVPVMEGKDVLPYLEQMIAWHRQAETLEVSPELPRELLFRNSLQQHATKVLHASFDFARAVAVTLNEAPKSAVDEQESPPAGRGIGQAIAKAEKQLAQMQSGIERARTPSARKKAEGQIKLAEEHVALLKTIAETVSTPDEQNDTLAKKIRKMASTIPELESEEQKEPNAGAGAAQTAVVASGSGIAGLAVNLYAFISERNTLRSLLSDTKSLRDDNRNRSKAVREAVQNIMQQGGITAPATTGKHVSPSSDFDALLAQMKKISGVAVALSQINVALNATIGDLSDWKALVSQHIGGLFRHLLFRVVVLALAIAGLMGLSTLAGRATRRYVLDERRQNQLRAVRKSILFGAIALTILLGFFTDLGSLATFAGLLTAGLAVALQNVILSIIAYFHFFGSFGIRPGDRITIGGVTGKVIQIGMLRFYLMELQESDMGYLPSGRVVGFSNAILFQPTPFFRQTPGTNFVWSTITLTLSPSVDHEKAYKKVCDLVQQLYSKHQDAIRRQEVALQRLTRFKAEISVPQTHLKITSAGLVLVIRYAVLREQERDLHLQMTEELLAALKKDPTLKLVNIG